MTWMQPRHATAVWTATSRRHASRCVDLYVVAPGWLWAGTSCAHRLLGLPPVVLTAVLAPLVPHCSLACSGAHGARLSAQGCAYCAGSLVYMLRALSSAHAAQLSACHLALSLPFRLCLGWLPVNGYRRQCNWAVLVDRGYKR